MIGPLLGAWTSKTSIRRRAARSSGHAEHLSADSLEWLGGLSSQPVERDNFTLTHASPRDPIWEYVLYPSVASDNFAHFNTPFCLVGHTHVPALHIVVDGETKARPLQPTLTSRWR